MSITNRRLLCAHRGLILGSTASIALCLAQPAFAQGAAGGTAAKAAPAADENTTVALEDIIVTAQRRDESLQNVPVAVSAFSSGSLNKLGIVNTSDLAAKVPGLTYSIVGPQLIFLRGVGTTASSVNNEASVATYIDGVYLYGQWANNVPTNNVQRVEVLKGPQGTLFGRNTTGGVVQLVTRNPMDGTSFDGHVGYANYDTFTADGYGALVLSDKVAASMSFNARRQGKGWGYNLLTQRETNKADNTSAQFKLVFEPSDATRLTGFFWYNNNDTTGSEPYLPAGLRYSDGVISDGTKYGSRATSTNRTLTRAYLGSLKIEQDLGAAQLVSISAYRRVKSRFQYDVDLSPVVAVPADLHQPLHNISQELQLLSNEDSSLKWQVGAFYFKGLAEYNPITTRPGVLVYNQQKTRSFSPYAQATIGLTDKLNFTGGIRYTWETVRQVGNRTVTNGVVSSIQPDQKINANGLTWHASVDYHLTDAVMAYASYSRGLKAGGFQLVNSINSPPFKSEHLDAYEVGLKSRLLDGRVNFNAAVFQYDFANIQALTSSSTGVVLVTNAAQARIRGAEAEVVARLATGLTFNGSVGYLDGKYLSWQNAVGNSFAGVRYIEDASGKRTTYTPEWTWSAGLEQVVDAGSGQFTLNAQASYTGSQTTSPRGDIAIPNYILVNGSVTWTKDESPFSVAFWVKNAFDKYYYANLQSTGFGAAIFPGSPRTYGITVGVKM